MLELYNIGLSDELIKSMIDINPEINDLSDNDINDKVKILNSINCTNTQTLSIISSNPFYLSRSNEDIIKLLEYLNSIGFICLNVLFDSNPYILNLDKYEIEKYINDRINKGEILEDIVDDLDSNPVLFQEI